MLGSFSSFARRFPERSIHVRVLWEDEPVKDAASLGDIVVQFHLHCHLDWAEGKRRHYSEPIRISPENRQIDVTLNLEQRADTPISAHLEHIVAPIVSPYKLTPLLLLTMYQVIEEKRDGNLIPKMDDQQIRYDFQPDLLDNAFREMFNATVGMPVEAAQERIIELAVQRMLESMYPDYDTLIRVGNWSSSLQKYTNALKQLETAHERQGQVAYEGAKDEVARLFTLSITGLDAFIANFPSLIEVVREFPTRREAEQGSKGAVRFRLHSLEHKVRGWVRAAPETDKLAVAGQTYDVHRLLLNGVYSCALALGYREKEIDTILDLMEERGLVDRDSRHGVLRETISQAPSLDELAAEIEAWHGDIVLLMTVFSHSAQLSQWKEEAEKARSLVEDTLRSRPDDEQAIRLRRAIQAFRRLLGAFRTERHHLLEQQAAELLGRLPAPDRRRGQRLEAAIQGSVDYVQQVNDLRIRVLQQHTSVLGESEKLRRHLESSHAPMTAPELPLQSLVRLAADLKAQEQRSGELQGKCETLATRFSEFAAWSDLVDRGSQLLQEIQTLGDLVREHREKFQGLADDIKGHLSRNKLEALPDAPTYALRLNEIAEAVRRLRAEATERFATLQERYLQALAAGLEDRRTTPAFGAGAG